MEHPPRIVLNVSGRRITISKHKILTLPNSKLASLLETLQGYDTTKGEFYLNRNPELVNLILDAYRCGTIHVPSSVCGNLVKNEVDYWGLSFQSIAPCCIGNVAADIQKQKSIAVVEKTTDGDYFSLRKQARTATGWQKWKKEAWLLLEYSIHSWWSKMWALFYSCLVIVSIGIRAVSTTIDTDHADFNLTSHLYPDNEKIQNIVAYNTNSPLVYMDICLNAIFTLETLLRILLSSDLRQYFLNFINTIDIISSCAFWIQYIMARTRSSHVSETSLTLFLVVHGLNSLRVFRIFKLARVNVGMRVLLLVVKNNFRDLLNLVGFLAVGMSLFSFLIFFAEVNVHGTFPNVFTGLWWSAITMTTVGYGRVVPEGMLGYVVGCVCATMGIIFTGMSIPIMSSSFVFYYNYFKYSLKMQKLRREEEVTV